MIKFSPSKQSFYDVSLDYAELPVDLIEVTTEQHYALLDKINSGHIIFADLTASPQRPDQFHIWNGTAWIDTRTDAEKRAEYLKTLRPLSRRQFKLALHENGMLTAVEDVINAIADPSKKARMQIEYQESVTFERTSDTVVQMVGLLGMEDVQIDTMWERALTL